MPIKYYSPLTGDVIVKPATVKLPVVQVVQVPCDKYLPRCGAMCCHLRVEGLWDAKRGVCRHLTAELGCGIYENRPNVCRTFDCRKSSQTQERIANLHMPIRRLG